MGYGDESLWGYGKNIRSRMTQFDDACDSELDVSGTRGLDRSRLIANSAIPAVAADPRDLLRLFDSLSVRATFFVPGLNADTYQEEVRTVAHAGHEVAHSGYADEIVTDLSEAQEEAVQRRGLERRRAGHGGASQ